MDGFELLEATPPMRKLCAKQPERKVKSQTGLLREYEASEIDHEIFRRFKEDYGRGIAEKGQFVRVKERGPHELQSGSRLTSSRHATTVFIPLTPRTLRAADIWQPPKVLYQPDRDNENTQHSIPWSTEAHFQIHPSSRIIVEEGPILFIIVEFVTEDDSAEGGTSQKEAVTKKDSAEGNVTEGS